MMHGQTTWRGSAVTGAGDTSLLFSQGVVCKYSPSSIPAVCLLKSDKVKFID